MTRPDASLIEPRFKESIDAFVATGRPTGGFLEAVLSNNLMESIARADDAALDNLPHIVAYLYNEVPGDCWGSSQRVREWKAQARTLDDAVASSEGLLR